MKKPYWQDGTNGYKRDCINMFLILAVNAAMWYVLLKW